MSTEEALAVIKDMRRLYSGAATYEDSGEVIQCYHNSGSGPSRIVKKYFSTVFVRPLHFLFDIREARIGSPEKQWPQYVAWTDGSGGAYSWNTYNPQVKPYETLGAALAAAAGVSSLASVRIPMLLIKNWVSSYLDPKSVQVGHDTKKGEYIVSHTVDDTWWVNSGSLLVLRSEVQRAGTSVTTTTSYCPVVNGPIDVNRFEWEPPFVGRTLRDIP